MPKKKTVVHIEDHPDVAAMVQAVFEGHPINWVVARTGTQGLRLVRDLQPDLVVLDLMLPDMPGREVFLQMQANPALKEIPVWVLSVIWWNANRYPWQEPSVVAYTFKPFEPYQFRDQVLDLLKMGTQ